MRGTLMLAQEGARSRAISDRISANGCREAATSASCKGCAVPVADERSVRRLRIFDRGQRANRVHQFEPST